MSSTLVLGEGCEVDPGVILGYPENPDYDKPQIGDHCILRMGTIIYHSVTIGERFQSGHNVMVREQTYIGRHVTIGTNTVIDGNCRIGSFVKIESNCYIPTHVTIGSRVFFGPGVILTNDRIPLKKRKEYVPDGPTIEDGVTLGAGVVVCPGVTIGHDSFVAAGATVTKDLPPNSFAKGVPAKISELPEELRERNIAISWQPYI